MISRLHPAMLIIHLVVGNSDAREGEGYISLCHS